MNRGKWEKPWQRVGQEGSIDIYYALPIRDTNSVSQPGHLTALTILPSGLKLELVQLMREWLSVCFEQLGKTTINNHSKTHHPG